MKIVLFLIDYVTLFFLLQLPSQQSQSIADFPTFQGAVWILLLGLIATVVWFLKTNSKKTDQKFSDMETRITENEDKYNDRVEKLTEKLNGFEKTVISQNGDTKVHYQDKIHEMERNILEAINSLKEHSYKEFATKDEMKEVREKIK
jgi:hypothetical protein